MNKIFFAGVATMMALASCNGNKTSETTATDTVNVDTLVFEGVLPLADAVGDSVRLELYADSTYSYRSSADGTTTKGKYVSADGLLTTVGENADTAYYTATPDSLVRLGADKKPAESGLPYVLKLVTK